MERVAARYPLRQGGRHGTWKFSRETGSSRLLAGVRELPPLRGLPGAAPASRLSALLALGKRVRRVRRRHSDRALVGGHDSDRPAAHGVPELRGGSPVHPRAPGTPPALPGAGARERTGRVRNGPPGDQGRLEPARRRFARGLVSALPPRPGAANRASSRGSGYASSGCCGQQVAPLFIGPLPGPFPSEDTTMTDVMITDGIKQQVITRLATINSAIAILSLTNGKPAQVTVDEVFDLAVRIERWAWRVLLGDQPDARAADRPAAPDAPAKTAPAPPAGTPAARQE